MVDTEVDVVWAVVVGAREVLVVLEGVVVLELVVVDGGEVELVVVLSAMVARVDGAAVAVVVGFWVVVDSGELVLVVSPSPVGGPDPSPPGANDGSPPNSGGAGTIRPRLSRDVGASMSRRNDVGDSGSLSEKPTAGMPDAGGSIRTLTAFSASGAATAAAVTVESDRASKNRPRPVGFLGCSKYICNPT